MSLKKKVSYGSCVRSNAFCGRKIIRNPKIVNHGSHEIEIIQNRYKNTGKPHYKFENKKLFNKKTIIAYSSFFVLLIALVAFGSNSIQNNEELSNVASAATATADESKVASVDKAVEANVVAGLAETANLPVAANTAEVSISLAVLQDVSQTDNSTITKPQIIDSDTKARGITEYTVKEGETAESIAADNGITTQTLKWSNGIKDDVKAGDTIKILPVDGVVHKVGDGETVQTIAEKYGSSTDLITTYNDLELGGLEKDTTVIVPSGVLPETERPDYVAPVVATTPTTYTLSASLGSAGGEVFNIIKGVGNKYGSSPYAYGNCTQYAYMRRMEMGIPIEQFLGNAKTWTTNTSRPIGLTPSVGAVMYEGVGGYGHVSVVEEVASSYIVISEMNNSAGGGFAGVNSRKIPMSVATNFYYIY